MFNVGFSALKPEHVPDSPLKEVQRQAPQYESSFLSRSPPDVLEDKRKRTLTTKSFQKCTLAGSCLKFCL